MQEALDFQLETKILAAAIEPLSESELSITTQFKRWTIGDVLQHLHAVNMAALMSIADEAQFGRYASAMYEDRRGLRHFENAWLEGLSGAALVDAWQSTAEKLAVEFQRVDPRRRLKWFGPDMSARSCITARQMETWAHGQEVFDILGVERLETDRLRNVAHLGVSTFAWTFANNGLTAPARPSVKLIAPSGAVWTWSGEGTGHVQGRAVEFCQVVTQTRNFADTALALSGEVSAWWMQHAQCFAGRPQRPPDPGTRFMAKPHSCG